MEDRGERMADRQCCELLHAPVEKDAGADLDAGANRGIAPIGIPDLLF